MVGLSRSFFPKTSGKGAGTVNESRYPTNLLAHVGSSGRQMGYLIRTWSYNYEGSLEQTEVRAMKNIQRWSKHIHFGVGERSVQGR